ncbi:uncharacterized protein BX663DRAFT_478624 [Cokeromyces recurvatus]|uniref:uncharacterized protein n=1 Tax=Cokeromyces recurvatus TaxID=90255 RepID=UPI00221F1239|nr:uncharacterized protein BX663DRAFT_478624 [Cokeromyces recurvatus]KAI7899383.1 hypothetical protein BX663DRAFT_478624 [Cokeromyces recurvatus]
MSNYNTFNNSTERYPGITPPDPLQRYGSAHLDQDIFGISVSRLNIVQQLEFARKVLCITTSQLLILAFTMFFIVKVCPLFEWLKNSTWTWWIPVAPTFLFSLIIIWQLWNQYFQLTKAVRTTLLCLYTLTMSLVIANIVSKAVYEEGISVIIMTIFGLSCCILYTFQKRYSFSGVFPFVCSLGALCLCSLGLRYSYEMDPIEILFPITIASLICIYIILELYFIMQNVTSDDFMLANVCFFVDVLYPIYFIHHVCELTDNFDNVFPDILYPGN